MSLPFIPVEEKGSVEEKEEVWLAELMGPPPTSRTEERTKEKDKISDFQKLYLVDSLTFGFVNFLVNKIVSKIIFTGNEEDVKVFEAWQDKINFRIKLEDIVRDIIICGGSWSEQIFSSVDLEDIKIINPDTMDYIRDNSNNIKLDDEGKFLGLVQEINGKKRYWYKDRIEESNNILYKADRDEDLRDKIRYWKLISFGESELGISFLKAVYRSAIIRSNLEDMIGESLTKDRLVAVKLNGNIQLLKFEHLWNKVESLLIVDNKYEIKLVDNLETLTENGWNKVSKIMRHYHNGKVSRVANYLGETVVTEDHSLFDENDNLIKASEFEDGTHNFKTLGKIDIPTMSLPLDLLPILNLKGKMEIDGDWINYTPWRICRKNPKLKIIYRNEDEIKSLLKTLAWFITEGTTAKVEVFDKRSNSRNSAYRSNIANNKMEELEMLKDEMRKIFDGRLNITKKYDARYDNYKYKLYSNSSVLHYLYKICLSEDKEKKIPEFIFRLPNHLIEYFIDEMIKGDGYKSECRGRGFLKYFDYASSDPTLICGMSLLFKKLGWKHSIRYKEATNKWRRAYQIRRVSYYTNREHKMDYKEIEYNDYVYDLEVPGEQYFYDMLGGIKVHNSAFRGGGIVAYLTGEPSQEQKRNLREQLTNITSRNIFLLKDNIKLSTIPIPELGAREQLLYSLADFEASGLGVPLEALLSGTKTYRQDFINKMADMESRIESYQARLIEQIKEYIVHPLLKLWKRKGPVSFQFASSSSHTQLNRSRVIATLARRGLISRDPELELHLRKELKLPTSIVEVTLDNWIKNKRESPKDVEDKEIDVSDSHV